MLNVLFVYHRWMDSTTCSTVCSLGRCNRSTSWPPRWPTPSRRWGRRPQRPPTGPRPTCSRLSTGHNTTRTEGYRSCPRKYYIAHFWRSVYTCKVPSEYTYNVRDVYARNVRSEYTHSLRIVYARNFPSVYVQCA